MDLFDMKIHQNIVPLCGKHQVEDVYEDFWGFNCLKMKNDI